MALGETLAQTTPLPAPTRDFAEGMANIRTHGVTIIPDALSPDEIAYLRDALDREIEWDRRTARHVAHPFDAAQSTNARVWNLISKDPAFARLAEHPLALPFVKEIIGWPARLSTLSGNVNFPGSKACVLHADQIWAPEPWPSYPLGVNCGWCIDDFTAEKGATRLAPGTHRLNRLPRPGEEAPGMVSVEAPAGSLIVFESRVWHQTGDFTATSGVRKAIFAFYQKPLYAPAENWYFQTRPEVLTSASDTLLELMGFKQEWLGRAM